MKTIRDGLSLVVVISLVGGYLASVRAALSGQATDYAAMADSPAIRFAALFLLIAACILALIPEREPEP